MFLLNKCKESITQNLLTYSKNGQVNQQASAYNIKQRYL